MKIKLAFHDWIKDGKSVYNSEQGIQLSMGDFHSGTVFDGEINLSSDNEEEILRSIQSNVYPVFYMFKENIELQVGDEVTMLPMSADELSDLETDYLSDLTEGDITTNTYDKIQKVLDMIQTNKSPIFTISEINLDKYCGLCIGKLDMRYMFDPSALELVKGR